ncbi:MAG: tRNA (5-methylaminomethyl-2-thiouridine)(34)-methyltransferase MnmD [Tannerellaceae bacterium]|nr:tRNA (5-methylaminomethyl-2-thiouridine)(34)-methyltransferase MnmD [Tannerellaceae bacterium]
MEKKELSRELQITADGSHTLFVPAMDEHYHSVNGAVQESKHVFIEAGLKQLDRDPIRIFEVGFGTGLNVFLTLLETEHRTVEYFTIEQYPLEEQLIHALNYGERVLSGKTDLFLSLHQAEWNRSVPINDSFTLHKMHGDSNTASLPGQIDLVYFDAFAPDKQPDMWNQEIFNKLYKQMTSGGILTTYCAKGVVRRMLQTAGFTVERIPGPPGKREMLRAIKV